jgi:hypothetical protein
MTCCHRKERKHPSDLARKRLRETLTDTKKFHRSVLVEEAHTPNVSAPLTHHPIGVWNGLVMPYQFWRRVSGLL